MQFIQGFSRIAAPLTSMLKTSNIESAELKKGVIGVGGDSKARRDRGKLDKSGMDNVKVGDNEFGKQSQNLSKSKNLS